LDGTIILGCPMEASWTNKIVVVLGCFSDIVVFIVIYKNSTVIGKPVFLLDNQGNIYLGLSQWLILFLWVLGDKTNDDL
jgi:hypothetical protein